MQTLNLYDQECDVQPIGWFPPEVLVADCLQFSAASMREAETDMWDFMMQQNICF